MEIIDMNTSFLEKASLIREYEFPFMVKKRLKYMYPHMSTCDIDLVLAGLKDYFIIILSGDMKVFNVPKTGVGMPSVVIDDAWHLWILNTPEYHSFCNDVFGNYVHHIPDDATTDFIEARSNLLECSGYKEDVYTAYNGYHALTELMTWTEDKLPILFMADSIFNIKDGFYYSKEVLDLVATGK